jgi:hypothetical protein
MFLSGNKFGFLRDCHTPPNFVRRQKENYRNLNNGKMLLNGTLHKCMLLMYLYFADGKTR